MERLRAPGGCPWDREQTFDSIKPYTLEETYEVFDAIERRHWPDLCEELGDLTLQVLFYAQMASEAGHFTLADVLAGLNRKLIRRHPHVFQNEAKTDVAESGTGIDSAQVLRNWEAIKQTEKVDRPKPESVLDAIPRALPAMLEARKLGSRAAKAGFDWPGVEGIFEKLAEEAKELREAIENSSESRDPGAAGASPSSVAEEVIAEVGDLLFTVVNLARHLRVDPEFALRNSNAKFRRRFALVEAAAQEPLDRLPAAQLDALWTKAKEAETPVSSAP